MHLFRIIAYTLVITGALVWGLVGLFNFNIVAAIFGDASILTRIIYSLVGVAGVGLLLTTGYEECYCNCPDETKY